MRIFSMRVALVLPLLSPWRPIKPVAGSSCTCQANQACSCNVGQSLTLDNNDLPTSELNWKKEGSNVPSSDGKVTVSSLASGDAGMYVAIDGTDVTKTVAYLVKVHDPVTTVNVQRVPANEVCLSCIASGRFKQLKWKKGGTAVAAGTNYNLRLNNAQLIIKDGPAKAGDYTCVAVQFDGSEKESPALHLSSVPDGGDVLLSNPGVKPSGGAGDSRQYYVLSPQRGHSSLFDMRPKLTAFFFACDPQEPSASVAPSYSRALLALCVLLLQLYRMVV